MFSASVVEIVAVDVDLARARLAEPYGEHQPPTQPITHLALPDLVQAGVEHLVPQLVLNEQNGETGGRLRPQVVAVVARRMAFSEQAGIDSVHLPGNG